jgi:hypothetical protein
MNLSFIDSLPDTHEEVDALLKAEDFLYSEQNTCDSTRWCYYSREFRKDCSNVMIRLVLRFEIAIYDTPTASYADNREISFNDAYLVTFDRQMQEGSLITGEWTYDEETESLRKIDSFPIYPQSIDDIRNLCRLLA